MNLRLGVLCAVVLAASAARPALASVVFDNGAPIPSAGGLRLSTFTSADDFILANTTQLTGGSFVYSTSGAYLPPTPLHYLVYANTVTNGPKNQPGAVLATGLLTVVDTAYFGPNSQYLANFLFDTPFEAQGGVRYWLGLTSDAPDIAWTASDFRSTNSTWEHRYNDPDGYWRASDLEANFTLSGTAVPEPATWAMLILGFGLTGGAFRRRAASIA